jgi:hypothetical protein
MNKLKSVKWVSLSPLLVVALIFASPAATAVSLNDYDYFKRVASGKERIIIPVYRGVPAKTRRLMKRAITQSYRVLGKRPIANTYALYWHTEKSNLTKVAKKWCAVAGRKGKELKRCMKEGGGWDDGFKTANLAAAVYETATRLGLMESTEGNWQNSDNNFHAKTASHEYFHVYQTMMQYYFEKEDRIGIPQKRAREDMHGGPVWMIEGGADYFAYNVMGKYKWRDYKEWMEEILIEAKSEIVRGKKKGIKVTLRNYSKDSQLDKYKAKGLFPHFHYDGGAWAMAYLRYLSGSNKGVFTNYYKDIAELERTWRKKGRMNYGWQMSFKKNFGMTVNQFYTKFNRFMKWPTSKQMRILAKPLS